MKNIGLTLCAALFLFGCVTAPTVTEEKAVRVVENNKSRASESASPEKQLMAMGYEISSSDNSSRTLAKSGGTKIVLDKTKSGYTVFRRFSAGKKLTAREKLEMLEIINKINIDNKFQVSYQYGDYIDVAIHIIGTTDAVSFATIIRSLEGSGFLFRTNPRMLELLRQ
jgi:hypothetical protein